MIGIWCDFQIWLPFRLFCLLTSIVRENGGVRGRDGKYFFFQRDTEREREIDQKFIHCVLWSILQSFQVYSCLLLSSFFYLFFLSSSSSSFSVLFGRGEWWFENGIDLVSIPPFTRLSSRPVRALETVASTLPHSKDVTRKSRSWPHRHWR